MIHAETVSCIAALDLDATSAVESKLFLVEKDRVKRARRSGAASTRMQGSVNAILAQKRDVVTPSPRIVELAADVVSPVRRVQPPTESCGHTRPVASAAAPSSIRSTSM
jgi:hypothetical protein